MHWQLALSAWACQDSFLLFSWILLSSRGSVRHVGTGRKAKIRLTEGKDDKIRSLSCCSLPSPVFETLSAVVLCHYLCLWATERRFGLWAWSWKWTHTSLTSNLSRLCLLEEVSNVWTCVWVLSCGLSSAIKSNLKEKAALLKCFCPVDVPRSQFPDLKNDYTLSLLTFNCDLDTFPHFSTSSDVKAYQMDLRSSDFKSILETSSCAKQLHFQAQRGGFYAATNDRRRWWRWELPNQTWGRVQSAVQTAKDQKESDVGQTWRGGE